MQKRPIQKDIYTFERIANWRERRGSSRMGEKAEYGNWVSKRIIFLSGFLGFVFLGLGLMFWVLIVPAVLFLLVSVYFLYVRHQFSPQGGNVQDRIWTLVLANLDWNGEGRALDIGCGNGALTIKLAQKYPKAQIIGIDYWGKNWEYSKNACERNAKIEGVSDRVTFQKASAASLPFDDGYFDAAVSNFVFHMVGKSKDKRGVVREALRVVKKGGAFSFQDEFLLKQLFGDIDDLIETIKSWGISKVKFVQTRDADFIPRALKLPFILGTIGLISGEK
jgi:ubiquinone/menaquinone biosynthesis C-methylase UbiE